MYAYVFMYMGGPCQCFTPRSGMRLFHNVLSLTLNDFTVLFSRAGALLSHVEGTL